MRNLYFIITVYIRDDTDSLSLDHDGNSCQRFPVSIRHCAGYSHLIIIIFGLELLVRRGRGRLFQRYPFILYDIADSLGRQDSVEH